VCWRSRPLSWHVSLSPVSGSVGAENLEPGDTAGHPGLLSRTLRRASCDVRGPAPASRQQSTALLDVDLDLHAADSTSTPTVFCCVGSNRSQSTHGARAPRHAGDRRNHCGDVSEARGHSPETDHAVRCRDTHIPLGDCANPYEWTTGLLAQPSGEGLAIPAWGADQRARARPSSHGPSPVPLR
jgi:hypothetical protein